MTAAQALAAIESWMPSLLTLSLALNLVLAVVLFFRSALNTVVGNAYSEWRTRKAARKQLLRDLYATVDALGRDHFLALATTGMIWNAQSNEERERFMAVLEEMVPKMAEANTFLTRHELEFPQNIRFLVDQLRDRMVLPSLDVVGSAPAIAEHSGAVNQLVESIKAAVSRTLK